MRRAGTTIKLAIAVTWALGALAMVGVWPMPRRETVVVTHWANVYTMQENVLPALAAKFNAGGHHTSAGQPIEVRPIFVNSGRIESELVSRARTGQTGDCNR